MKTIATAHPGEFVEPTSHNPAYQAYQILRWGFVIVPVVAGIDNYLNKLTEWAMYLWTPLGKLVGGSHTFLQIAGAIQILAGCLVAVKPKVGAPIVAIWLLGIVVNLLLLGTYGQQVENQQSPSLPASVQSVLRKYRRWSVWNIWNFGGSLFAARQYPPPVIRPPPSIHHPHASWGVKRVKLN